VRIKNFVGSITHAPAHTIDNIFIKRGYRVNFNSYYKAFKSLFMLHNELVNVWSHLIGAILVISVIIYTIYVQFDMGQIKDKVLDDISSSFKVFNDELHNIDLN
jgi:adiponectin receptor